MIKKVLPASIQASPANQAQLSAPQFGGCNLKCVDTAPDASNGTTHFRAEFKPDTSDKFELSWQTPGAQSFKSSGRSPEVRQVSRLAEGYKRDTWRSDYDALAHKPMYDMLKRMAPTAAEAFKSAQNDPARPVRTTFDPETKTLRVDWSAPKQADRLAKDEIANSLSLMGGKGKKVGVEALPIKPATELPDLYKKSNPWVNAAITAAVAVPSMLLSRRLKFNQNPSIPAFRGTPTQQQSTPYTTPYQTNYFA